MMLRKPSLSIVFGTVGLVVGIAGFGAAAGALLSQPRAPVHSFGPLSPVSWNLDTASRGKSVSMATGPIEAGVEGLFALDHSTGNLYCWILNPRSGEVSAVFQTNVLNDLGTGVVAEPDYVMVTGVVDFSFARAGNMRPAKCVVYVAESGSGKFVGYSLIYNRQAVMTNTPQAGNLQLVCQGMFRGAHVMRDQ